MEQKIMQVETVGPIRPPMQAVPLDPEEAAAGHSTVTMVFDKPVLLTVAHGHQIKFPAGTHEVPKHLSEHWYLKAHGVRPYHRPFSGAQPSVPAPPLTSPIPTGLESLSREELVAMAKGYGLTVHPATGAAKLIEKISAAKSADVGSAPDEGAPIDGAQS